MSGDHKDPMLTTVEAVFMATFAPHMYKEPVFLMDSVTNDTPVD